METSNQQKWTINMQNQEHQSQQTGSHFHQIGALNLRIASLEAHLNQALKEKSVADQSMQYVLRMLASKGAQQRGASTSEAEMEDQRNPLQSLATMVSQSPFQEKTKPDLPPRLPFRVDARPLPVRPHFEAPAVHLYGVCYHTTRAVTITSIPPQTTLTSLLRQVRSAAIFSAQLFDTSPFHPGDNTLTAYLHFHTPLAAETFTETCQPLMLQNQQLQVRTVPTPSYPLNPHGLLAARIAHDNATRCLHIVGLAPHQSSVDAVLHDLRPRYSKQLIGLEWAGLGSDGAVEVRLSSVALACNAVHQLRHMPGYRDCRISWIRDPCDGGWNHVPTDEMVESDDAVRARSGGGDVSSSSSSRDVSLETDFAAVFDVPRWALSAAAAAVTEGVAILGKEQTIQPSQELGVERNSERKTDLHMRTDMGIDTEVEMDVNMDMGLEFGTIELPILLGEDSANFYQTSLLDAE